MVCETENQCVRLSNGNGCTSALTLTRIWPASTAGIGTCVRTARPGWVTVTAFMASQVCDIGGRQISERREWRKKRRSCPSSLGSTRFGESAGASHRAGLLSFSERLSFLTGRFKKGIGCFFCKNLAISVLRSRVNRRTLPSLGRRGGEFRATGSN